MAFVGLVTSASGKRRATTCMSSASQPGRREFLVSLAGGLVGLATWPAFAARPEGVNRPELLPKTYTTVVDLEKFLTSGERQRLENDIRSLEDRTSVKLRVLTQRYPQTPGLAVKDYWSLDDDSILMVADFFGGTGNLLKFNVGEKVYDKLPPRFWSLLAAKFGSIKYVKKYGEDGAIVDAVYTIKSCLLKGGCPTPP